MGDKKPSVGGLFGATTFILFVSTLGFCAYVCTPSDKASSDNNQPSTSYSPPPPTYEEPRFIPAPIRTCDKDIDEAKSRQRKAQVQFQIECGKLLRDKIVTIDEPMCVDGKIDHTRPWVNLSTPLGETGDRLTSGHTAWYRVPFDADGDTGLMIPSKRASAIACKLSEDRIVP